MTIHDLTIEQMREIVEGAPELALIYDIVDVEYYSIGDISIGFSIDDCEGCIYLEDLNTAIAQHYQDFEQFLTDNNMPVRKTEKGYLFSNRLVYEAWVKSPELGLKCIQELKGTEVKLPEPLIEREFKVGDWVEPVVKGSFFKALQLTAVNDEYMEAGNMQLNYEHWKKVDANTDTCLDIRNHLSPSTKYIELEAIKLNRLG